MKKCIKMTRICAGRECRDLSEAFRHCCREEIEEEKHIVLSLIDAIDDCTNCESSLTTVSSRLSYASNVIYHNNDDAIKEVMPIIRRFSTLLYESKEKILTDSTLTELTFSFVQEIKAWFSYTFLREMYPFQKFVQPQSIAADISTIEMALGICMIEEPEEDFALDDLFF